MLRELSPTLHTGKIAERSKKYFKGGNGALVGIEVKGGVKLVKNLLSLKNVLPCSKYGDARSLAIHPATTTHSQLQKKNC